MFLPCEGVRPELMAVPLLRRVAQVACQPEGRSPRGYFPTSKVLYDPTSPATTSRRCATQIASNLGYPLLNFARVGGLGRAALCGATGSPLIERRIFGTPPPRWVSGRRPLCLGSLPAGKVGSRSLATPESRLPSSLRFLLHRISGARGSSKNLLTRSENPATSRPALPKSRPGTKNRTVASPPRIHLRDRCGFSLRPCRLRSAKGRFRGIVNPPAAAVCGRSECLR
jgi:hypothetical protein